MGEYVVSEVVKLMIKKRIHVSESDVLVLGLAFKENCPDIRNTRVIDIIRGMESYGANVDVYDSQVDPDEVQSEYGFTLLQDLKAKRYHAIILAVSHMEFHSFSPKDIEALGRDTHVFYDIKHLFSADQADGRL